jgi:hypothetical protein
MPTIRHADADAESELVADADSQPEREFNHDPFANGLGDGDRQHDD